MLVKNRKEYTTEGNPEVWDDIWDIKNKTNDLNKELFINKSDNDTVRTGYYEDVYKNILQDMGAVNVECILYNSYFKIHNTQSIESNFFNLPICKSYYSFKKDLGKSLI